MKLITAILTLALSLPLHAQVVRQPLSVALAALGAYSKNFSDVFSGTTNQASLASLKTGSLGLYGERRFMLNELTGYTAIIAVPTSNGTFGLQAGYFGSSSFNESEFGLIYARKVSGVIDIGAKFNDYMARIPGYGVASAINFDVGAIFHLTEKLHSGVHVYNPTGSSLGKTGSEKLASVYSFGLGYEASDQFFIGIETVKHEDQPVAINAGLQYNLHKKCFIRCGISTGNDDSYAGVGLYVGFGRIDVNTAYHPQLGFTPGVLLLINLKKPVEE